MVTLPSHVLWYGVDQPLAERHILRAGPLSMVLEHGALRSITLGQQEIVRSIYTAVRDKNWGTIEPHFLSYEVQAQEDRFFVHLSAEHINEEIHFTWQGSIEGTADGTVRYTFDGRAERSFLKNRIGFCVLHPMKLAGVSVEIETPHGVERAEFPVRISPQQLFKDILAMRFDVPSQAKVEIDFEGDVFEMEDQRNWTDASYKTYCTPLRLPFPVKVASDERISQTVTMRVLNVAPSLKSTSPSPLSVSISEDVIGRLPSLGFGVASHEQVLSEWELERLRLVRPGHLWVECDLMSTNWKSVLLQASQQAQILGTELEISALCDDAGMLIPSLIEVLVDERVAVARLFLYPHSTFVTTERLITIAAGLLEHTGLRLALGCGSRANFAEFNRAALPLQYVDVVGYAINPQVHAFDNASLIETLAAQEVSAINAQALAGSLPLSIGPVTLKPRFNAAATSSVVNEVRQDVLPETVDVRQMSLFGAGWTIGSIGHLARAGVRWATYYETTGWRGLMKGMDNTEHVFPFSQLARATFPIFHVFADLAEFIHASMLKIVMSEEGILEALALKQGERFVLFLANVSDVVRSVQVEMPFHTTWRVRILDEKNAETSLFESTRFRQDTWFHLDSIGRKLHLELLPYAFVRLDAE